MPKYDYSKKEVIYLTKATDDPKRNKKRCMHYKKTTGECCCVQRRGERCPGSAHCDYYIEKDKY